MAEKLLLCTVTLILLRGRWKGVAVYDAFLQGGRQGMDSALGLLPALLGMTLVVSMAEASGLSDMLASALAPALAAAGIPGEAAGVLLLRPLSGSGALAALQQVIDIYGVDSRAARCAAVMAGSSETIFYTITVYLGTTGVRRLPWAIPVSLISYGVSVVVCGAAVR